MYIRKSVEDRTGESFFLANRRNSETANGVLGRGFSFDWRFFRIYKKVLSANLKVTGRVLGLC